MTEKIFSAYLSGVKILMDRLGKAHPMYLDVLGYQAQLIENIENARREDTPDSRSRRNQIVEQLNRISENALGMNFNEICFSRDAQQTRINDTPMYQPAVKNLPVEAGPPYEPDPGQATLTDDNGSGDIASNLSHPAWQGIGAIATIILGLIGLVITIVIALIEFQIIDLHSILP